MFLYFVLNSGNLTKRRAARRQLCSCATGTYSQPNRYFLRLRTHAANKMILFCFYLLLFFFGKCCNIGKGDTARRRAGRFRGGDKNKIKNI